MLIHGNDGDTLKSIKRSEFFANYATRITSIDVEAHAAHAAQVTYTLNDGTYASDLYLSSFVLADVLNGRAVPVPYPFPSWTHAERANRTPCNTRGPRRTFRLRPIPVQFFGISTRTGSVYVPEIASSQTRARFIA